MQSPGQALLWKNWQLTWRPFLLHQLCVITAISLLMLVVFPQEPLAEGLVGFNWVVQALILVSMFTLLGVVSSIPIKSGEKGSVVGFPFRQEYVLPISTPKLVFIPLVYLTLLLLFSYSFPLLVISTFFVIAGPQFIIIFLLFELILMIFALSWWSSSHFGHTMGWIVMLLLIWNQTRFMEFGVSQDTFAITLASPSLFVISTITTAAMVLLMFFGVRQQRHGDSLIGDRQEGSDGIEKFSVRSLNPFTPTACPVHSTVAAELWKERQLKGFGYAGLLGVLTGVLALLMLRVLRLYQAFDGDPIGLEEFLIIVPAFYFMLFMVMQFSVFGVGMHHGTPLFYVFDRTTPMNTAKLVSIKLSVNILGLFVAACAMAGFVWFFGPLFLDDFAGIRSAALGELTEFMDTPLLSMARQLVLWLTTFSTAAILFASVGVWFMLKPQPMGWLISLLMIYFFSLVVFVAWITEASEFNTLMTAINSKQLWVLILGFPSVFVYLFREIMKDRILNVRQLLIVTAVCSVLGILYFSNLISSEFYITENIFEVKIFRSLITMLPLFAIGFVLWTMSKIRHH